MGVSVDSGGGGRGRKSVDAELNLIPFIDLLSVCILFLLMTAVWVQISKMSAFSQPSGETTIHHSEVSTINEAREERDFDFLIRKEGIQIVSNGKNVAMYAPEKFREQLQQLKPHLIAMAKTDNPKISLRAEDQILYDELIQVLDGLFASQFTNITIGGMS